MGVYTNPGSLFLDSGLRYLYWMRIVAMLTFVSYLCASLPSFAAAPPQPAVKRAAGYTLTDEAAETKGAEYVMRQYPGEKLMAVRILSGVKNPGIYYVPEGTDMLTAISLAGGLNPTADSSKVRWNQWSTQKHDVLDLEDAVAEPKRRNPALGANDVVLIDETKPWISNNTLAAITVVASLIGIALGARALAQNK